MKTPTETMKEKLKVLFVENNPSETEKICSAIASENIDFEKRIAETEDDYLLYLMSFKPDVVVSDISLPWFGNMSALGIRNRMSPELPFLLVNAPGKVNEPAEFLINGANDCFPQDNLSSIVNNIRNLSEKKIVLSDKRRVEKELKESNELNKLILQTIPFGMEIIDETGTILFQNDTLKKLSGTDGEGKKCWEVNRDDGIRCSGCPLVKGLDQNVVESHESPGILGARTFDIIHTGMMYKGKKAILEIFLDITERKAMEEMISNSEAHYRALTDLSPDGIIMTDLGGKVKYVSKKVYEIFGVPENQNLIGESILKWVNPGCHEMVIARISDLISGRSTPEVREYKLLKNDGSDFLGELSSTEIPGPDGIPESLLVVCRDVTERARIEKELISAKERAEESDRLKSAFLQNISHEIRTPLNAIVGFALLLSEDDLDTTTRKSYVDIITESSNHLVDLLNDIIDMSSIEAGRVKLNREEVNLNRMLRSIYRHFRLKAERKALSLSPFHDLDDEDALIVSDGLRIRQVLSNLIGNAIKFTSEGSVKFGYNFKGNEIEFYVTDTGMGISEADQKKIFDRFFQIENPETKQFMGLGLGLPIAKAYSALLGGGLVLTSTPGKGSTFKFSVPYEIPAKANTESLTKSERGKAVLDIRKKILVAEDTESNFKLVSHYLSRLNADVIRASDGVQAVEMSLGKQGIDLILMDVKMPVMDGFTATKKIKAKRPDIPIVIQTAYVSDMGKAIECGCDAFITKPYDRRKIESIILDLI